MATYDDVSRLAAALPDAVEGERRGHSTGREWTVNNKVFAWERAFSKADVKRFGDGPMPAGPILAVVVGDLGEKEAVLAAGRPGFFTIPHFNGYAAVLVELDAVDDGHLAEALTDAWLAVAPEPLAHEYLTGR
ncbi:MmcQ/YjbR family DNA-binding protein [Xylanimonas sp. McL0601]|uniref:MmcQ/YjbR family DNA-binding protein n=1 Tax=Xylanimonas sp. McL0601 TaxID=3414739 RepID=UPI003CE6E12F